MKSLILGMAIMTTIHHKGSLYLDRPNVAQKIVADFLKQPIDTIFCQILTGGSEEGAVIKCTCLSIDYLVKQFSIAQSGKNEIAWTKHASDLSIGPKLYYADLDGSYMITEFVEGNSLVPEIANTSGIIKNIAASLLKLHASSAPFAHSSNMFTRIDAKYRKLEFSGKLKELLEKSMKQVKTIETQLQDVVVRPVPCHNDLNPGNIFVHDNKITLIDWGDAALDNPYYDIAAFFVLNCIDRENQKLFFEQYDQKLFNSQWQVYMQLYKQLVHFEFALNLLLGVQTSSKKLLDRDDIPHVKNLNYYLTLLAKREVEIDSAFLYTMAVASLREINNNKNLK